MLSSVFIKESGLNLNQLYQGLGIDPTDKSISEQLNELELNWTPQTSPIRYGEFFEFASTAQHALYRPTDGQPMGIVSPDWFSKCQGFGNILEIFSEFCRENGLTKERVGKIESFSRPSEFGHQILQLKLWCSAAGSGLDDLDLGDGDLIIPRLQLVAPYQYGEGYQLILSAYRKVCTNGLHIPIKVRAKVIGHRGVSTLSNIERAMAGTIAQWKQTQTQLENLADTVISEEEALLMIVSKFGDPLLSFEKQPKIVQIVLEMFRSGSFIGGNMATSRNTVWGLLNCLTEYQQHVTVSKNPNTQLNSVWLGAKQQQTLDFLNSISSFATEARNRNKITDTVPVAVRGF